MEDITGTKREWENTVVGEGYQSRGVIRQPTARYTTKFIDMSKPDASYDVPEGVERTSKKSKKSRKEKEVKHKKHKHKKEKNKRKDKDSPPKFNPFLQLLALQISDTTLEFSV